MHWFYYLQQSGSAGLFGWWLIWPRPMRVWGWASKWIQQRQSSTGSLFRSQSNAVHVSSSWQSWPQTLKSVTSSCGVPPSAYMFTKTSKWGSHTVGRNKCFTHAIHVMVVIQHTTFWSTVFVWISVYRFLGLPLPKMKLSPQQRSLIMNTTANPSGRSHHQTDQSHFMLCSFSSMRKLCCSYQSLQTHNIINTLLLCQNDVLT